MSVVQHTTALVAPEVHIALLLCCDGASTEAKAAPPGHAGSHAGPNGYARRPVNDSFGGKRDRGADVEDMEFIEDDAGGGDGDWRAMLRDVTGGYDPSKCA